MYLSLARGPIGDVYTSFPVPFRDFSSCMNRGVVLHENGPIVVVRYNQILEKCKVRIGRVPVFFRFKVSFQNYQTALRLPTRLPKPSHASLHPFCTVRCNVWASINVAVLQHPAHFPSFHDHHLDDIAFYWAHHEKLCLQYPTISFRHLPILHQNSTITLKKLIRLLKTLSK